MDNDLAQKAVSAALLGDWQSAITFNKEILSNDSENIDALNRLARAYAETGNTIEAIKISNKVIALDPYNTIALKCVEKWKDLDCSDSVLPSGQTFVNDFIEEPGKTKLVTLIHSGDPKLLAKLDSGDEVKLNPHGHRMSVVTLDGKYVGKLPDDIGAKLKLLMKMGNEYKVVVKCSDPKEMKIFIRETKTAPELKDVPSFTHERIDYISFTPPELVHKKDMFYTDTDSEI